MFTGILTAVYSACFSSTKKTCVHKYQIGITPKLDDDKCKVQCSNDQNCKFAFRDASGFCITYKSCDKTRNSHRIGTTFAKEGKCPGRHN